jgi:hypothetical protein
LHDGDVVRVLPGTAKRALPGELVAAVSPSGDLAVGVLAEDAFLSGAPVLQSDWDGPGTLLCCCEDARLLGVCVPVRLVRAGNVHRRAQKMREQPGRSAETVPLSRVPVPYRRSVLAGALVALAVPALDALGGRW